MRHSNIDGARLADNSFSQNYGAMAQCRSSIEPAGLYAVTFVLSGHYAMSKPLNRAC